MKFRTRTIILFAACVFAAHSAFAAVPTYADAKAWADRDEAAVSKAESADLLKTQRAAIDRIVPQCAGTAAPSGMPPFVVVVELDEVGNVVKTWREGDSDFAACFERKLGGLSLFVPPHAPFYTSFEMSMARGH
ncbi:hypothetical protein ACVWWQ_000459 [Rhodanobacter sp. TND4EL1]